MILKTETLLARLPGEYVCNKCMLSFPTVLVFWTESLESRKLMPLLPHQCGNYGRQNQPHWNRPLLMLLWPLSQSLPLSDISHPATRTVGLPCCLSPPYTPRRPPLDTSQCLCAPGVMSLPVSEVVSLGRFHRDLNPCWRLGIVDTNILETQMVIRVIISFWWGHRLSRSQETKEAQACCCPKHLGISPIGFFFPHRFQLT